MYYCPIEFEIHDYTAGITLSGLIIFKISIFWNSFSLSLK
jgi:hypothetical protein